MGSFDVCKAQVDPQHYFVAEKSVITPDAKILKLLKRGKVEGNEQKKLTQYEPPCDSKKILILPLGPDKSGFKIVETDKSTQNFSEIEVQSNGTTFRREGKLIKEGADGTTANYEVGRAIKTANFFGANKRLVAEMRRLLEAQNMKK